MRPTPWCACGARFCGFAGEEHGSLGSVHRNRMGNWRPAEPLAPGRGGPLAGVSKARLPRVLSCAGRREEDRLGWACRSPNGCRGKGRGCMLATKRAKVPAKDMCRVSRHLNKVCNRSAKIRWKLFLARVRHEYSFCTDGEENSIHYVSVRCVYDTMTHCCRKLQTT